MNNDRLPDFDALWDYNNPDKTEQAFAAILDSLSDPPLSYRLELLTQIARTQGLLRKFGDAHRTLDNVQSGLTDAMQRVRVRYLLERGRVFNSSKRPDDARPLFLGAWELARESGEDALAVDAAHMMGIIEPPAQQHEWNLKALDLAERSANPRARKWRGSLYNNIGWTYHDEGRYPEALETFEKGLEFQLEHGSATTIRIARWTIARTLRSLGRVEEALASQREQLAEVERVGEKGPYVYEEVAECLLALGHAENARPYFAMAYEALSKDPWLVDKEPERLERLKDLGQARE